MSAKVRLAAIFFGIAAVLGVSVATLGTVEAARPVSRYILPGNNVFPEGVAYEQGTPYFYVSSTTDGTIFRGTLGVETTRVFLPGGQDGRTSATGLKAVNGKLYVSGAGTGNVFIYSTQTGALLASFNDGAAPNTFVNDVTVTRNGDAYFTDSVNPVLYRVTTDAAGNYIFENWLDLTGTPIVYQSGFNLNGIASTENGRYLVTVQSNTGKLFLISTATREVTEIDLGGATVTNGDGIYLQGHTLYVVRNSNVQIVKIQLSGDYTSGRIKSVSTDASLRFPTTVAIAQGRLLVVNSQFNNRCPTCTPELPFTVSSIKVP